MHDVFLSPSLSVKAPAEHADRLFIKMEFRQHLRPRPMAGPRIRSHAARLRIRSYPEMWIQIGSPRGAIYFMLTTSPGKQPISSSFSEISLSVTFFISPDSPGIKFATVFKMLFRFCLNKDSAKVRLVF